MQINQKFIPIYLGVYQCIMLKIKVLIFALVLFCHLMTYSNVIAQQSATNHEKTFFLVEDSDYSHYLHKLDKNGEKQRVFGLGIYVDFLHPKYFQAYDFRHNRIPDDNLFESLRQNYNLIYGRFTYTGPMVRRPDFYDSLTGSHSFIMGAGHLPWYLRFTYSTAGDETLSISDQQTLASRIDREKLDGTVREIIDFTGNSNLIINLADEPELGVYGDNWFYTTETLRLLYDTASQYRLVSLGLGPVGKPNGSGQGSKLIWSLENTNPLLNREPSATRWRQTSKTWQQVLGTLLDYYEDTFDVLYLNSYRFTIADNRRAGAIVREVFNHPTLNHKNPFMLWISAENFRHDDPGKALRGMRGQSFSALANNVSGLLYYPDVSVGEDRYDEKLWELSLDLIKEIGFFRPVLERGKKADNFISDDLEWIHHKYKGFDFVFGINHSNIEQNLKDPGKINMTPGASGVWYKKNEEAAYRFFEFPKNLSFHSELNSKLSGRFNVTGDISLSELENKIGKNALKLTTSGNESAGIEFDISALEGMQYEIMAWVNGCEASEPELRAYAMKNDEILSTSIFKTEVDEDDEGCTVSWDKIRLKTDIIPEGTTHLRIYLGAAAEPGISTTYFDDVTIRLID